MNAWYLCRRCLLLQKKALPADQEQNVVQNTRYRADFKIPSFEGYEQQVVGMGFAWEDSIKKVPFSKNMKVLDFGSGDGALLEYLMRNKVDAIGLEPSQKFASYGQAKGHQVINDFLRPETFEESSFDIVNIRNSGYFSTDLYQTFSMQRSHPLTNTFTAILNTL